MQRGSLSTEHSYCWGANQEAVVRLMSEYMAGWPLWSLSPGDNDRADKDRLSPALRDALYAWEALFERHFSWDTGWESEAAAQQYQDQAVPLVERLRLELGPEIEVVTNLWPLRQRQAREEPDPEWLADYHGLTLEECTLAAQQAARPYQVLSPAHTTIDADYQPDRLNVLVDSKGNVQKLWSG